MPFDDVSTLTAMPSAWQTSRRFKSAVTRDWRRDRATSAATQSARLTGRRVRWYCRARSLPAAAPIAESTGTPSMRPSCARSSAASSSSAPPSRTRWSAPRRRRRRSAPNRRGQQRPDLTRRSFTLEVRQDRIGIEEGQRGMARRASSSRACLRARSVVGPRPRYLPSRSSTGWSPRGRITTRSPRSTTTTRRVLHRARVSAGIET